MSAGRRLLGRLASQPQIRPFRNREFRYLWIGMATSLLGDGMFFVAMPWLVLSYRNTTGALALIGVVMAAAAIPPALLVGSLEQRLGARQVMTIADAVRAAVLIVTGLLSVTGTLALWELVLGLAVFSAGDAVFIPAFGVLVQQLVTTENLVGANAADQIIRPLMWRLIGPAIGGLLAASIGVGWVFLLDALTFAVSFCCLLKIRPVAATERAGSLVADAVAGWRYVVRTGWLRTAFAAGAISVLCVMGPWNVLVPFVVRNTLRHGVDAYGLILSVGGIGQAAAALIVGRRPMGGWAVAALYLAWGVTAGGLIGFALGTSLLLAIAGSFVVNGALAVSAVLWGALLQTAVPERFLSRVFGIDWALAQVLTPISYVLASALASASSAQTGLLVAAAAGLTLVPALLFVGSSRTAPVRRAA